VVLVLLLVFLPLLIALPRILLLVLLLILLLLVLVVGGLVLSLLLLQQLFHQIQIEAGVGVVGIFLEGVFIGGSRFLEPVLAGEGIAQVVVAIGAGLAGEGIGGGFEVAVPVVAEAFPA